MKAMYAFSGDPITYGHIDIVERTARIFDEVLVGIGANPKKKSQKKYLFSLEERTEMAKRSLKHLENVEVTSFEGLLVDFAYEQGIPCVVKGVRDYNDLIYETQLHQGGETQDLNIETFLLIAKPELAHVSSSMVKALQEEQGLIHECVPLYVKQCLEAKMSGQYIIGITGEMGSGKSYVSNMFVELGKEKGISLHNIELDNIGHQILGELKDPLYVKVRERIINEFGEEVGLPDSMIDRKTLGEIVFGDENKLKTLNEIMHNPLRTKLRRELHDKKGLILINAALIAESKMTYLCNSNLVLVTVDKTLQEKRLKERELSKDQIERRLNSQYSQQEKELKIKEAISQEGNGKIWTIESSEDSNKKAIENVFDEIVGELKIK